MAPRRAPNPRATMRTHATMKTQKLIPRLLHGLLAVALVATVGMASAQQKFVRGQGNGDSKEAAVAAAKISAWKNYLGLLQGIGSANRTFSGRAEKLNDAGREAMTNAAKAAADVVVNQLNLK